MFPSCWQLGSFLSQKEWICWGMILFGIIVNALGPESIWKYMIESGPRLQGAKRLSLKLNLKSEEKITFELHCKFWTRLPFNNRSRYIINHFKSKIKRQPLWFCLIQPDSVSWSPNLIIIFFLKVSSSCVALAQLLLFLRCWIKLHLTRHWLREATGKVGTFHQTVKLNCQH